MVITKGFSRIGITLAIWLCCHFIVHAQSYETDDTLQRILDQYTLSTAETENVIVHTDRSLYIAGESIWYKINCMIAGGRKPSALSKAVYLELLDSENQQIAAQVIRMEMGSGDGGIEIPGNLASGIYYLRAYTAWMKNTGPDGYFLKTLKIFNPFLPLLSEGIWPEGTEKKDNEYRAVMEEGAVPDEYPLPRIQTDSWLISMTSLHENNIVLTLYHPSGLDGKQAFMTIFSEGRYRFLRTITLTATPATIDLTASTLGSGINYIIIFDSRYEPVCYRPVFGTPMEQSGLTIENLQPEYKNREKVVFKLKSGNISGANQSLDLSVSVVLDDEDKPADHVSQLSGAGNAAPRWKAPAMLQKDPLFLPEPEGPVLSGTLINKVTGVPEADRNIYFSWVGGTRNVVRTRTNPEGRYFIRIPEGEGNRQFIVQAPEVRDESLLTTDGQFSQKFTNHYPFIFDLSEYSKRHLEKLLLNYQITVAYNTIQKKVKDIEQQMDFYGKPDDVHEFRDYIKLPLMEEFFRELIRSTILTREKGAYMINVIDGNLNRIIGPDPGYLIDGVPVFHSSIILDTDPQVFRDIRVINNRYFYKNISWDGIVDISSLAGDFSDFELPSASVRQSIHLFEPPTEFVPVQYHTEESRAGTLPDYRTLLLWQPYLPFDRDNWATVEFTTSDVSGRYKIVIQGVTASGESLFLERSFLVRTR